MQAVSVPGGGRKYVGAAEPAHVTSTVSAAAAGDLAPPPPVFVHGHTCDSQKPSRPPPPARLPAGQCVV